MDQLLNSLIAIRPGGLPLVWWLVPLSAVVALVMAYRFHKSVMSQDEGTPLMIEIAGAVRQGARAYLVRQYRVIAIVFFIIFLLFLVMAYFRLISPLSPFTFVMGGLFSAASGIIGMNTATHASSRTAAAASKSLNDGLQVAFRGGAVMGMAVVGFVMLNITLVFLALFYVFPADFHRGTQPMVEIATIMISGVFGASGVALFARVGGGIFTKAADVGADLVGKVEEDIPEDDPRNPAVIADNVGDNVGDVAGLGADLYESYFGSILATVVLGVSAIVFAGGTVAQQINYMVLPLSLAAIGVFLAIFGISLVRVHGEGSVHILIRALDRGVWGSAIGVAIFSLPLVFLLQIERPFGMWGAIVTGILTGVVIGQVTNYFTADSYKPTQEVAAQAVSGPATVIIEGQSVGMRSTALPVIIIVLGIVVSYYLAGGMDNILLGLFGVGMAAVAMLSNLGMTLATDAYGPISDNAGGNAQMAGLPAEVRHRTDQLDSVGNTTAATGKGFAIGSAALTALALLVAFMEQIRFEMVHLLGIESVTVAGQEIALEAMSIRDFTVYFDVTLLNPSVIAGLFLGGMTVYYFSSLTMSAVGRAAREMVLEVRHQFATIPGLREGTAKPDYARCVDISTKSAQREMVKPAIIALVTPLAVGMLFGVGGIMGLLAGSLASGFVLALMMANAGGAWDNAKKYIENGAYGGKGSFAHKAAVVGDMVGDPFKDTCGPSLDILIKLMSIVSVTMASLIAMVGQGGLFQLLLGGG
jgi:K(+)-stimulated pyrophosphate-energized sodium pump